MKTIFKRFNQARNGAVAMIFALALVPLVLFVALAIDYSFFTEARSQIQLAADAAVTHAIRTAAGTYSLEINAGVDNATATQDARNAGYTAGQNWFVAQLGALPTAYIPAGAVGGQNPNIDVEATTNPAGFQAGVSYQGNYPPFFDNLFKSSATWYIKGFSLAQTQYSYVEIMMMLDISQSMLIGATPADITKMSTNTICMPAADIDSTAGDSPLNIDIGGVNNDLSYEANANDGDQITDWSKANIPHYNPGPTTAANYPYNGTCDAANQVPGFYQAANKNTGFLGNLGYAGGPCAFACHNSGNPAPDGSYKDLYGVARRNNVTLRLDVVFQAAEQVIQSMLATESVANQFAIGLYGFNTNVSVLATGTQGNIANGDPSKEATYSLNTALQALYGIDYSHAAEKAFPPVDTVDDGNTNFVVSMKNFYNGTATGGVKLAAAGAGVSTAAPLKNLFIVTDGQEDECCQTNSTRYMGGMTGYKVENGTSTTNLPTVCKQFKTPVSQGGLGYNVYVLYIDYNPVPTISYYYAPFGSPTTAYLNDDYPPLISTLPNMTTQERQMTLPPSQTGTVITPVNPNFPNDSPNEAALRACASPGGFYEATKSSDIATKMNQILKSALSSAIRVTN